MQQRLERALSVVFDCDLRKNLENPDFPSIISGLIDLLEEDNFQLIRFSTIKNLFLLFTSKKVYLDHRLGNAATVDYIAELLFGAVKTSNMLDEDYFSQQIFNADRLSPSRRFTLFKSIADKSLYNAGIQSQRKKGAGISYYESFGKSSYKVLSGYWDSPHRATFEELSNDLSKYVAALQDLARDFIYRPRYKIIKQACDGDKENKSLHL